jgi:hypothetical protein
MIARAASRHKRKPPIPVRHDPLPEHAAGLLKI